MSSSNLLSLNFAQLKNRLKATHGELRRINTSQIMLSASPITQIDDVRIRRLGSDCHVDESLSATDGSIERHKRAAVQAAEDKRQRTVNIQRRKHGESCSVVMHCQLNFVGGRSDNPDAARDVGPSQSRIRAHEHAAGRASDRRIQNVGIQRITHHVADGSEIR